MEAHLRETLEPDSAPSDFTVSEEMFDGSSSLSPEMPVSEENLGGESSTSLLAEALGDRSLVAVSNQNGSSPKAQDDRSLVLSASNPTGSSTILPPIDETLGWSSSVPAQTGTVDDYPNFSICSDDEPLEVEPFTSSSDRFLDNNLLESSSSRWSSSHGSSPWPSCSSSRGTWSSSPSALSFSIDDIKPSMVGAGLANLGNTCFINAVLQCFTHTVPLVEALRSCSHAMPCDRGSEGFCVLCALIDHVERSFASSGGVISPLKLVDNLNNISSFFQRYQQEDAHEFLQCFLDKLERCCLDLKIKDKTLLPQDNNIVERVFGGRLVSKLRCCNCGHSSDTYEPLIDLSLEIEDVDTLPSALESFTKVEKIEDSETKFTCENCKEEVLVEKQFMLDQAPSVAAFHLKRFKTDGPFVEKVDKHVQFPLELDLQPFTTGSQHNNVDLKYNLYAIVVHIGFSSTSGHYFCFIRSSPETWYRLDDSKVTSVAEEFVLSQEAYILFYARDGTPWLSSLMEAQKPLFDPNIFNTSPKSVLDNVDSVCASYPSVAGIINCDDNESRNAAEGNYSMFSCGSRQEGVEVIEDRDAAAGSSGHLSCRSKQDELRSNDLKDGIPMDYTSTQLGARNCCDGSYNDEKLCTTSSLGGNSCQKGIDEVKDDGFHSLTPPGSPSPDKASLASPGVTYHIPRAHLKKEKQVSCKKQSNNAPEDSKIREAMRYLSKSAPQGRKAKLMDAMLGVGSHSDGPLNKRKRMVSSPCKKTSTPGARRKSNHDSIMQPVAAAIFR